MSFVLRAASVVGLSIGLAACTAAPASRSTWLEPATGMAFVPIEPGQFLMGSPAGEADREDQEVPHRVTLTQGFWFGQFEVTQGEWQRVMHANPSWFHDGADRRPVENVTLLDVYTFLDRLTRLAPGSRFRLPTEAEWEYACRAGTQTPFNVGPALSVTDANVAPSPERAANGHTLPVGTFAANRWGLHDMHGNVWEWTADEHCAYPFGAATDPVGRCGDPRHVIRGGSWRFGADSARCALRYTHLPEDRGYSLGFRVVRGI